MSRTWRLTASCSDLLVDMKFKSRPIKDNYSGKSTIPLYPSCCDSTISPSSLISTYRWNSDMWYGVHMLENFG